MTTDTIRRPADDPAHPTFEGRPLPDPTEPAWDQGLAFDVQTADRPPARAQGHRAAGISLGIAACAPGAGSSASATASASATSSASAAAAADCTTEIPEETAGPFPGDGTNGPDVLNQSGVVRKDITLDRSDRARPSPPASRSRSGSRSSTSPTRASRTRAPRSTPGTATRPGATRCTRRASRTRTTCAACRRRATTGSSSSRACSRPATRAAGRTSTSRSTRASRRRRAARTRSRRRRSRCRRTTCDEVYATSGYEQSVSNMNGVSLERDMVFADDGAAHQLGTISGSVADGLVGRARRAGRGLTAATPRRAPPSSCPCPCRACRCRRSRPRSSVASASGFVGSSGNGCRSRTWGMARDLQQ